MGVVRGLLYLLGRKRDPEVLDLTGGQSNLTPATVVDPSGGIIRGARRVYQPRPGFVTVARASIIAGVPSNPTLVEMCRSRKLASSYQIDFDDDESWCILESDAKKIREARSSQAPVHFTTMAVQEGKTVVDDMAPVPSPFSLRNR